MEIILVILAFAAVFGLSFASAKGWHYKIKWAEDFAGKEKKEKKEKQGEKKKEEKKEQKEA